MKLQVRRRRKAVSLVEILLTVALLAITLCTILGSFTACFLINETNRNITKAVSHGEFVIEEIKNASFATLQTAINSGNFDWNTTFIAQKGLEALSEEGINTQVQSLGASLLHVTVTVSWTDRSASRTYTLETLIADL